jgi:hypothetical protein
MALQQQLKDCKGEFKEGFESLRCRLDLIAGIHGDVKLMKDEMETDIKPTIEDYNSKKKYALGAIGFSVFIWGSTIEAVKGVLKSLGVGQ